MEVKNQTAVLTISENIHIETGVEIRNTVLEVIGQEKISILVLDFSRVNKMDSIGLGSLLSIFKTMKSKGIQFGLFGVTDSILNLFEITQVNKIIPIYPDLETAVTEMENNNG